MIKEFRGVADLVYAKVLSDNDSGITFGEVKPLAGVARISKEVETSSETHYYDNKPAVIIQGTGADTITISTSALESSVLADITGQVYDANKKMLIEGELDQSYFAIGYKTKETDGTVKYVWRYKGTFAVPNEEHNTEDDGTDANGQELTYTGIMTTAKFGSSLKSAKGIVIDSTTAAADFFDEVKTPDKAAETI